MRGHASALGHVVRAAVPPAHGTSPVVSGSSPRAQLCACGPLGPEAECTQQRRSAWSPPHGVATGHRGRRARQKRCSASRPGSQRRSLAQRRGRTPSCSEAAQPPAGAKGPVAHELGPVLPRPRPRWRTGVGRCLDAGSMRVCGSEAASWLCNEVWRVLGLRTRRPVRSRAGPPGSRNRLRRVHSSSVRRKPAPGFPATTLRASGLSVPPQSCPPARTEHRGVRSGPPPVGHRGLRPVVATGGRRMGNVPTAQTWDPRRWSDSPRSGYMPEPIRQHA